MKRGRWTALLTLTSALLVGNAGWHLLSVAGSTDLLHHLVDLAMIGGSAVGVVAVTVVHVREDADREYPRRILWWFLASPALFVAVAVTALYAGSTRVTPPELLEAVQLSASVGVFVGLLVGRVETRAVENAQAAARAAARADALAAERDRFDRINGLLRHYVNNVVTVIGGHTGHLEAVVPDAERERLDAIDEHTRTIVTLVDHVSELSAAERADVTTKTIALDTAVDSAATGLRVRSGTTVRTPDDGPPVRTSDTVEAALSLLCDALLMLDEERTVTVRYEPRSASQGSDPDAVRLVLEAVDAELPEAVARAPFAAHGTGVGLRLYLARELLGADGEVALADGHDGVRLVVDLRRA